MTELLPCPFCGGTNIIPECYCEDDKSYYILCRTCHATTGIEDTKKKAIKVWNQRYTPPSPAPAITNQFMHPFPGQTTITQWFRNASDGEATQPATEMENE